MIFFSRYLTTFLVMVLTVCLVARSYRLRRQQLQFFVRRGIPGPTPHLIMGNGNLIRNRSLVAIAVMDHWQRLYGQLYGYFIGMKPYVVISDLDHIHQVAPSHIHLLLSISKPRVSIINRSLVV